MFNYDKNEVVKIAKSNDFIVNNTEKVLRLSHVINFINQTKFGDKLSLKGGTAINIYLLNLSRLSVDIDYDFSFDCPKEEMLEIREEIRKEIISYMSVEGYLLSGNSKHTHTLDSFVFSYATTSGSRDNLKIEINYSNRIHVLPVEIRIKTIPLGEIIKTNMLGVEELIGSKLSALIERTVPRDIYDCSNLFKIESLDYTLIKKIAVFYLSLGCDLPLDFNNLIVTCKEKIENVDYNKLRDNLLQLLHRKERIEIGKMKEYVIDKIENILTLNDNEKSYIDYFNNGIFKQELLFERYNVNDLSNHPMVKWKTK